MASDPDKRLLLVEDEVLIALSKQKDLEKYGYKVLTVNTGEKAVAISKKNKNIDLILIDIDLGHGIDGTEAAQLILKEREVPVVFMSSHTEPEVVEKTEKITSYGYVVKSSCITVLDTSIKMVFKLFEAHKKIYESERRYRELYENSPLGYQSLSAEGKFVEVNPALCDLLGYEKKELLDEWVGKILTPDSIETLKINFPKFKSTGQINQLPFDMVTKTGDIIPVEIDGNASYDKNGHFIQTHCVIRNVTIQKHAEKALEELKLSEEKFKTFTNQATEGITVADMEGNYTFVNPAFCKMSGYKKKELLNMTVFDMKAKNQPHSGFYDSKEDMEGIPIQVNLQKKDNTEYMTEIVGKVITIGNRKSVLGTIRDITDRKKAEKSLIESEEKFSKAFFNHPVAMQIINIKTGQRIEMNEKCIKLFGIEKKELIKENSGNVNLTIQDNGNGLPDGFDVETQRSFGLMLVKMLSEQLGGSFTIENNNGTRSTLEFSI